MGSHKPEETPVPDGTRGRRDPKRYRNRSRRTEDRSVGRSRVIPGVGGFYPDEKSVRHSPPAVGTDGPGDTLFTHTTDGRSREREGDTLLDGRGRTQDPDSLRVLSLLELSRSTRFDTRCSTP